MLYNSLCIIAIFIISCCAEKTRPQFIFKSLYVVFPENLKGGPKALAKSINDMIRNNSTSLERFCKVYPKEHITLKELEDLSNRNDTLIWFEQPEFFDNILSDDNTVDFSHVMYGPTVTPISWMNYPYRRSYEMKWKEYLSEIFGYVCHYPRVRDHLMEKSDTTIYKHKYIFFRTCTSVMPPLNTIKSWDERKYDFLIFQKYADLNMKRYGKKLVKLLKNYNNKVVKYGSYKHSDLLEYAADSKCVIYFSFYDTGPVALEEIQNYGVYAIVLQNELIDDRNGVYISELEYNIDAAAEKCKEILKIKRDTKFLSKYNIEKNSCLTSFKKFYKQINNLIYKRKRFN